MRVIFDHQAFVEQPYGGISRYIVELHRYINQMERDEAKLSLLLADNEYISNNRFVDFFIKRNFPGKRKMLNYINSIYNKTVLHKGEFDLFHATYYDTYYLNNKIKKPLIVTYHDMIHELFTGKYHTLDNDKRILSKKKCLAKKANKIIAVSNSTKKDLIEILNVPENRIDVIHHGCSLNELEGEEISRGNKYILYVGSRLAYKNFSFMLNSIRDILVSDECYLLCVGGGQFSQEEKTLIKGLEIDNHVQWYPIIDDVGLQAFYNNAIAFIFPTLYEGFGMPILEAFSSNCPCLLSKTSSLPEVAGEAALYFDPKEENEILLAVSRIISDFTLRQDLIKKGKKRLKDFSWAKTAEETVNTYRSVS